MLRGNHWTFAILFAALLLVTGSILWFRRDTSFKVRCRVGVILARTGHASLIGKPEADVIEALLTQPPYKSSRPGVANIPGFGAVAFDIRDSGGSPDQAEALLVDLARNASVVAIIGPSTSGESIRAAKRAKALSIPLLSLAASSQITQDPDEPARQNRWTFKFAQNDDLAAQKLFAAMIAAGVHNVALLYSQDGFGKSGAVVVSELDRLTPQVAVVFSRAFPPDLTTPETLAAAIPETADGVLVWGTSPGPALLLPAIKAQRPNSRVFLSHGNASQDFIRQAGPAAEHAIVVGSRVLTTMTAPRSRRDSVVAEFQDFWQAHFSSHPSHFAGHARDAFEATLSVLERLTNQPVTRNAFRDGLEELGTFNGVTGTFTFTPDDHAGLTGEAFETYVIQDGAFAPFYQTMEH